MLHNVLIAYRCSVKYPNTTVQEEYLSAAQVIHTLKTQYTLSQLQAETLFNTMISRNKTFELKFESMPKRKSWADMNDNSLT